MECENCNHNFADTAKFCPKCGTKAKNQVAGDAGIKKCPNCGAENPLSAKFCKVDGYNFQQTTEKSKASNAEAEKPSEIFCPKCGTAYDIGVKFCKSDGTRLQRDGDTIRQTTTPKNGKKTEIPKTYKTSGSKTRIIVVSAVLVFLILNAAVSYLYLSGYIGSRPEELVTRINDELKGKGLSVSCEIDEQWNATLKGTARNASDKELAKVIVSMHEKVKDLKDDIRILPSPSEVKVAIDGALRAGGIRDIYADVDNNLTATLQGVTSNKNDKDNAMEIAARLGKAKNIKDNIRILPSPSEVKVAIDNALRAGGIMDIHADVDNNLTATLQGVTSNNNEKDNAMKIATGLGTAKNVIDNIRLKAAAPKGPVTVQRPQGIKTRHHQSAPSDPAKVEEDQYIMLDPASVEVDLSRALRNAGIRGITAEVGDDLSVTLKGSTGSADDKNRALGIARSFKGVRKVRDRIFVVW
ncbi:MAG: BON domain-containing protein [Nitrospirae bacterium]|uniref:BON domain-containing protein n=1 Tax=Candidatus Magnetobacterium casense TaxID=1455061 RepID=UPI00058E856C|nr:BON domain-containing protein [Candidatus Magnetobacterium casensis]MBF0338892.1 BON domain-containing protein [Nitrospirota bacterium]